MLSSLLGLSHDDIGGLTSGRPWLLLEGKESWQAVHTRLRDDRPKGVIISSREVWTSFMQAWRRAGLPQLVVVWIGKGMPYE